MTRKVILSFARMPEFALTELRDGLLELGLDVMGVTSHGVEAPVIKRVFPNSLYYPWVSHETVSLWEESFDSGLYERVIGPYRSEALPLVERYGAFEGGSIEAELRLMYYYTQAKSLVDKIEPDLLLFAKQPESALEYLLYRVGKDNGIKTIFSIGLGCLQHMQAAGTELHQPLLDENWNPTSQVIPLGESKPVRTQLDLRTIDIIERIRDEATHYSPDYMKGKVVTRPFIELLNTIFKRLGHPKKLCHDLIMQQDGPVFKYRLLKNYEKWSIPYEDIEWGQQNIYFPLHYQPELTTMPLGGCYVNQARAIKVLSDKTPSDTKILVKEHNSQFAYITKGSVNFRPRNFYRWLSSMPKVQLLDRNTPSGLLQQTTDFTAVVTGTAGFEALVRGKPVLSFGSPYYLNGPNVFPVGDGAMLAGIRDLIGSKQLSSDFTDASLVFLRKLEGIALAMSHSVGNFDITTQTQINYKDVLLRACRVVYG